MRLSRLRLFTVIFILNTFTDGKPSRPNIVLIIADDMGWNDVSFHGSDQIMTPNIDLLAYSGVALERYYTHCVCTPSRSALYTGKFAHVLGMQGYPLTNGEDRALPLTEKILPQYLKDLGYATHLVGKWHVGHARSEYLPTFRGFDTHFGHRTGYIDYYEYTAEETWEIGDVAGLDFFRNITADWESAKYVTDLYSEEAVTVIKNHNEVIPLFLTVAHNAPHSANAAAGLQAPPDEVRKMRHVESPARRIFAAMVKKLDDSVGDIVKALHEKGILDNTIIAFVSDNGGMTSGSYMNYASNWPLRGLKMTPFEDTQKEWVIGNVAGLDIFRNVTPDWESTKYVTDLYSEEAVAIIKEHNEVIPLFLTVAHNAVHSATPASLLQAPPDEVRKMRHVESMPRRIYAAMVKKLDDGVGDIIKALHEKGILDNTIIAFVSDNGGMTSGNHTNFASNWPLRGLKMSPYEGGVRVNALIWSKNLTKQENHRWNGYMHVVDWVPTLLSAAGAKPPPNIDGVDLWESLTTNKNSKRDTFIEIDDYTGFESIVSGDYKLVSGNVPLSYSDHQGQNLAGIIDNVMPSYKESIQKSTVYTVLKEIGSKFKMENSHIRNQLQVNCSEIISTENLCYPEKESGKMCLYNIIEDPCEMRDLSATYPHIAETMNARLQKEFQRTIPRMVPLFRDPRAAPSLHGYVWTTWADDIEP